MPEQIIISDRRKLKQIINIFSEQDIENVHVLADFDRTLTQAIVAGEKVSSLISILRKENILNEEYTRKTEELFNIYHPIEIDSMLPLDFKKAKMAEWWELHNQELLKHGLNKKHLDLIAFSPKVVLRPGTTELLNLLYQNNIPVVIMSSSGVGEYVIKKFLEREKVAFPNIKIISNSMSFDSQGNLIGFNKPYIHVLNKDETMIHDFPEIFAQIKDRKNVILLGDNIEDIGMVEGFDYDNLIKIGFLNEQLEDNLEAYKRNFDLLILNDGSLEYVTDLVRQILSKN